MKYLSGKVCVTPVLLLLTQVLITSCQDTKGCDCGQKEYYDPEGTIQSPDFPENYPNDCNCAFRIFTNRDVKVSFSSFALEGSEDCRYDYLQFVFDASAQNAGPKRYCGDGLSNVDGGTLSGKGPLIVMFKSDESDSLQGFRFTYKFELQGLDPCLSEPCVNGGNCSRYPGYFMCECSDGYAGATCDVDVNECSSYPCKNGGSCIDALNSYSCECQHGYTGDLCETKPELCLSEPCINGGLCVERGLDYVCSCPRDFMGIHCESEVPTPPPRLTTTVSTTTIRITTTTLVKTTTAKASANSSFNQPPDQGSLPDSPTSNPNVTEGSNQNPSNESKSNGSNLFLIVIIFIAIVLLLLLLGLAWYCWKRKKSRGYDFSKKITTPKEEQKSKSGKGKKNRRLSRTTSFNSVLMKSAGREKVMAKMSEDIIVEEVTEDSQSLATKLHPVTAVNLNAMQAQQSPTGPDVDSFRNNPNSVTHNNTQLLPRADNNKANMTTLTEGHRHPLLHLSPEDAVNLLNQMKENRINNIEDNRSVLQQYGLSSLPTNPFSNTAVLPQFEQQMTKPGQQNNLIYNLPNMPYEPGLSTKNKVAQDTNGMMELSPEEAADVVNCLLQYESSKNSKINPIDAMNIIREVKSKREAGFSLEREKSVLVHPREVAHLVNHYPSVQKHMITSLEGHGHESVITSAYDPSESGDRHQLQIHKDFREYSPIQEESDTDHENKNPPVTKKKRPSQVFGNIVDEPELKRLRKKAKHFPYAGTLDPDEKVHDWLKSTPKRKLKHQDQATKLESLDLQSKTVISRPMATQNQDEIHRNPNNSVEQDSNTPRTIRQTRKGFKDNPSSFKITENKAKTLVDKLLQAPARSSHNVVGPGLAMSRENAFVGENF